MNLQFGLFCDYNVVLAGTLHRQIQIPIIFVFLTGFFRLFQKILRHFVARFLHHLFEVAIRFVQ